MSGPTTEVLNDDLKEIRGDLRKVECSLFAEIHQVEDSLGMKIHQVEAEIHRVDNTVAKLGAEFAGFKWLLGVTLATTLLGIVGAAFWTGTLTSRVASLEGRVGKIDARLDKIDTRLDGVDGRLGRIEASVTRAARSRCG